MFLTHENKASQQISTITKPFEKETERTCVWIAFQGKNNILSMSSTSSSTTEKGDNYAIKRRSRIKYTTQQVDRLERAFGCNQYPDSVQMEDLAVDLGVTTDRVAIWFQNRRSKFKRQQTSDHLQWMRKQIFQNETVSSTSLPVFSSVCHVLSPLESQIVRRELPAEQSPNVLSPEITNRPTCVKSEQTHTPAHYNYSRTSNQHGEIPRSLLTTPQQTPPSENRPPFTLHPAFSLSSYTPTHTPQSMYLYGRMPFQPIHPENFGIQHRISTTPVQTPTISPHIIIQSESAKQNQSVSCRSFKVPTDNQESVSSRSFILPDHPEESKPTHSVCHEPKPVMTEDISVYRRQENFPARTVVSPEQSQESQLDDIYKEFQDQLLQQKALECLAQWC